MIREIIEETDILKCVDTIRDSFITVANELNLTPDNAPTNPAFLTVEKLRRSFDKGLVLFGFFEDEQIIGCVAIENTKNKLIFFIERLAVLPEHRHKGYGKTLIDFAIEQIKN